MKRPFIGRRFVFLLAQALILSACAHHGMTAGNVLPQVVPQRNATAQTYSSGTTSMTITPNFAPGFGPVPYNTQLNGAGGLQIPSPGSGASLKSGDIDFGSVEQDLDYLYVYAVQLAVTAPNGFELYGEANGDLSGTTNLPVSTHVFWLPTTVGKRIDGSTGDTNNTWSSPSTPFLTNSNPGNETNPPIYATPQHSATLSYDYILRLAASDPIGSYSTVVTYSVVAR